MISSTCAQFGTHIYYFELGRLYTISMNLNSHIYLSLQNGQEENYGLIFSKKREMMKKKPFFFRTIFKLVG